MANDIKYTVFVAEDESLILKDIIDEIENARAGFHVIGSAFNGSDALEMIENLKPDVLFTDIRMPIMDGLELIKRVRAMNPDIQIVILSGYSDFEYAKQAMKLGVSDYLLKPLDTEPLVELLKSLGRTIDQLISTRNRSILTSTINGLNPEGALPSRYSNCWLALFLVCIGNLCDYDISGVQSSVFNKLWEKVDLSSILPSLPESISNWWIIDERVPNQKFIVAAIPAGLDFESSSAAERLRDMIQPLISPYPVYICIDEKLIPHTGIYSQAHNLRLAMERKLVIGKSAVIRYDLQQSEAVLSLLDANRQNRFLTCIRSDNWNAFRQELYMLFGELGEKAVPQKLVEKYLFQLLKLIVDNGKPDQESDPILVEHLLGKTLASAAILPDVRDDVMGIFENLFRQKFAETHSFSELVRQVDDYMKLHFSEDISIEDLSRKFNFNGTYITRIFKKYKGESPVRYLISLRINEAKKLFETHPDLDIKQVSEMVGYGDSHYFSRIFRNITGISPSEYKERL